MSSVEGIAEITTPARSYTKLRWWIAFLLFVSTVINYIDRQNLSILARTVQDELKMSDVQYGYVVQGFLLAYTITYLFAGRVTDRIGSRLSLALFVGWWSIADMLTSLSRSFASLAFFRFLLGIGEPGNYTAAPKAVAEWFPPKEQGLIIGLYTAGATLGATLAPPLVALVASRLGWRAAFLCTGSLGLLWIVPWLLVSRRNSNAPVSAETEKTTGNPWREVMRRRETWLLMISRLLTDPVWYFYLFWFPKYLNDSRHLTLIEIGKIGWVVYFAADIGCLAAGFLSAWMIRRGMLPSTARIRLMAVAACLVPLSVAIAFAPSALTAVGLAALAALGHLCWQTSLSALLVDLYPRALLGTVFGLVAAGSGLGGMLSTNIVSHVIAASSYTPVFLAMGLLHPAAFLLVRRIR